MKGTLRLQNGMMFEGESFGADVETEGEAVFTTGMVGYPESLTDPSYVGQILISTYPILGSYGVPEKRVWESESIQVSGFIVSQYIDTPSHYQSVETLATWLKREGVPALEIKDTRLLALTIRERGSLLGRISFTASYDKRQKWYDPNTENLVERVSIKEPVCEGEGKKTVMLVDCGNKLSIKQNLLKRNLKVVMVPWNYDVFSSSYQFDGIVVSNGPGDPTMCKQTIATVREALNRKVPYFGICLGNQILALAAGGETYKMKFGHRGQNQPCKFEGSKRCYLTTQNHGFAIKKIPHGFKAWFTNANDNTNEGIIHTKLPFMSVQFHPEVMPGPFDTDWIFDYFIKTL